MSTVVEIQFELTVYYYKMFITKSVFQNCHVIIAYISENCLVSLGHLDFDVDMKMDLITIVVLRYGHSAALSDRMGVCKHRTTI